MKIDRKMLELAAKAAGYKVAYTPHWDCLLHVNPKPDPYGLLRYPWTPDHDDGDLFRLAADLEFDIVSRGGVVYVGDQDMNTWYASEAVGEDKMAARRLAIIRAAAKVGEQMP